MNKRKKRVFKAPKTTIRFGVWEEGKAKLLMPHVSPGSGDEKFRVIRESDWKRVIRLARKGAMGG